MLAVFAFPAFHHCFLKLPNGTFDLKNKINSTQWGHSKHRIFPNLLSQDELIHFFASPEGSRVVSAGLGGGKSRSGSAIVTENVQRDQNEQPGPRLPSSSGRGSGVSEAFGAASRTRTRAPPRRARAVPVRRASVPERARVRGLLPGKGACRWVSGNSTMRRGIPV